MKEFSTAKRHAVENFIKIKYVLPFSYLNQKTRKPRSLRDIPILHKTKEALSASRKSLSFFNFYCTSCAVYAQRTHLMLI